MKSNEQQRGGNKDGNKERMGDSGRKGTQHGQDKDQKSSRLHNTDDDWSRTGDRGMQDEDKRQGNTGR